ncbi:hypothetical protein E4U55_006034, partial [Claviceps digitariae]
EWINLNGKFTLSDDSHGIAQLATNYPRGIAYLASLGVQTVWTFERQSQSESGESVLLDKPVSLDVFRETFGP